jgi:hypothetical protein
MWLGVMVFLPSFFSWSRRVAKDGKDAVRVDKELVGFSEVKAVETPIRGPERVVD